MGVPLLLLQEDESLIESSMVTSMWESLRNYHNFRSKERRANRCPLFDNLPPSRLIERDRQEIRGTSKGPSKEHPMFRGVNRAATRGRPWNLHTNKGQ